MPCLDSGVQDYRALLYPDHLYLSSSVCTGKLYRNPEVSETPLGWGWDGGSLTQSVLAIHI